MQQIGHYEAPTLSQMLAPKYKYKQNRPDTGTNTTGSNCRCSCNDPLTSTLICCPMKTAMAEKRCIFNLVCEVTMQADNTVDVCDCCTANL